MTTSSGNATSSGSSTISSGSCTSSSNPGSQTSSNPATSSGGSSGPATSSGAGPSSGATSDVFLGSSGLSHTSSFDVAPIFLGPVDGYHGGTASLTRTQLLVEPDSVPGSGNLSFRSADVHVTTMLFQLSQDVVPNWFGVAIPEGVTDFSKPNIFFHPIPGQDGYVDADYSAKTGKWPNLFYYMELLGYELDGAIKQFGAPSDQVIVMPFLTSGRTDTGILPANWFSILTDILTDVRTSLGAGTGKVDISEVAVSSFSVGYVYSLNFRQRATDLKPLLKQVWDFDGYPKNESVLLTSTADVTATKYDQGAETQSIHLPLSRWAGYPDPAPNPADPAKPVDSNDVHRNIRNFMFLDAATKR